MQAYASTITHGSAGMTLLYRRLARETGEACYRAGSRRWLGRLLAAGEEPLPATLCSGSLGNALVLMTEIDDVEPSWSACLGL